MGLLLIAMLLAGVGGLAATRHVTIARSAPGGTPPSRTALAALVATLVATFVAQLETIARASREQVPFPAYLHGLPLVPILDRAPLFGHTSAAASIAAWLFALFETLELAALAALLRGRTLRAVDSCIVAAGSLGLVVAAFTTRGLTSADMYAYMGYARLGVHAYDPPAAGFVGPLAAVNGLWGVPLVPCAYGPLWVAVVHLILAPFASLASQAIALRALGACSFFALVAGVAALRAGPLVIALVALNPALVEQFVADGHNDGIAIALALAAVALGRRHPPFAIALAAAASLVKLPFVLIGALAFAAEPKLGRRIACVAGTLATAGIASIVIGGHPYARAIARTADAYGSHTSGALDAAHIAVAAVAAAATIVAVVTARFGWQAAWSFAGLARTLFPWYVGWGIPYAILAGRRAWIYLASLPLLADLAATNFSDAVPRDVTLCAFVVLAALCIRDARSNRSVLAAAATGAGP